MKTIQKLWLVCAVMLLGSATAQAQTTAESRLNKAIADATAYLDTCQTNYYPYGLLENLRDAITAANNLRAGDATTTELNSQRTKVTDALSALSAGFGKVRFEPVVSTEAYDPQRGFIHPGGLHTRADFDRIKALLAAGNEKVTAAYNVLKTAGYAQPGTGTSPVETIVRGGGSGENYINAARGGAIAYQNALRWQIEGNEACAKNAVKVLMAWANTTKGIGGDTNYALAAGLYGYAFAQAAELVRDYDGWSAEDFQTFRQWMLDVWYPSAMGFLRGRNGTWENAGRWWQAPGHYWSNWGLCNALCILSIGVLCDDVFIYNQGLSFIKHDQCGTFTDPRTANPIVNDGLVEFFGNLIVTTSESELETGAYGKLGQMNESGRDGGHAAMALGLAVDVAHLGYNQGDDLFAFMDHRLAAGIEFTAACTQSVSGLPWTNYQYVSSGYAATDGRAWVMTEPAMPAHTRNYWGTVIGHYEGVKGVRMPFSEKAYAAMGIDGGGAGATSGGYDHLGYSVLMNTREPQLAPAEQVPTELAGHIVFNGRTLNYNELGGLTNTYTRNNLSAAVKPGQTVRLVPVLPEGEENTGKWLWESGETTQELEVTTDRSQVYRVTYTNARGIESQQCFSIAVQGDSWPQSATTSIALNGEVIGTDEATVDYGSKLTLTLTNRFGGGIDAFSSCLWDTGATTASLTTGELVRDRDFYVALVTQGGAYNVRRIRIHVKNYKQQVTVNETDYPDATTKIVEKGDNVVIGPVTNKNYRALKCQWDSGETSQTIKFDAIETSQLRTLTFTDDTGEEQSVEYRILVKDPDGDALIEPGNYIIRDYASGLVLTNGGSSALFEEEIEGESADASQVWKITAKETAATQYNIQSVLDDTYLTITASLKEEAQTYPLRAEQAVGADFYVLRTRSGKYWGKKENNKVDYGSSTLTDYPFQLIPVEDQPATGIEEVESEKLKVESTKIFDLQGRHLSSPRRGINLVRETLPDGTVRVKKVFRSK